MNKSVCSFVCLCVFVCFILFCVFFAASPGDTQIWIGRGCTAGSSRPYILMLRDYYFQNRYPFLEIFSRKMVPISCDFATRTHQILNICKMKPIIRVSLQKKKQTNKQTKNKKKQKKKTTHFGGTLSHVLRYEYTP